MKSTTTLSSGSSDSYLVLQQELSSDIVGSSLNLYKALQLRNFFKLLEIDLGLVEVIGINSYYFNTVHRLVK